MYVVQQTQCYIVWHYYSLCVSARLSDIRITDYNQQTIFGYCSVSDVVTHLIVYISRFVCGYFSCFEMM